MVYGFMTHSYLNSTEHRQIKRERKVLTEKYVAVPRTEVIVGPRCHCRSFRLAHDLEAHKTLQSDRDWTPWEERYVFNPKYECYDLRVQTFNERLR